MANKRGKEVDTTFLSLDHASERGFIHRDYLAHCLRWSHVAKFLNAGGLYKTAHVLDVGCGRETPLPKLLYSSRLTHTTGSYTGVDVGPILEPKSINTTTGKFRMELHPKTDFLKFTGRKDGYNVIVSFEVMEHVEPHHTSMLLRRIREKLAVGGTAFVSTPCYDQKTGAADNHVNEMSFQAFKALVELAGFTVVDVWGTFASQRDYKKELGKNGLDIQDVFDKLNEYYDSNVLACLFAPLFPELARNCIWKLQGNPTKPALAPAIVKDLQARPEAHSSSARWAADFAKILKECKK